MDDVLLEEIFGARKGKKEDSKVEEVTSTKIILPADNNDAGVRLMHDARPPYLEFNSRDSRTFECEIPGGQENAYADGSTWFMYNHPTFIEDLHFWWHVKVGNPLVNLLRDFDVEGSLKLLDYFLEQKNQKSILLFAAVSLVLVVCMLVAIAYYTLAERKVMAFMQRRRGPNVVGFWGLLQPLADGMKLIFKEIIVPRKANIYLFLFAPIITFILALVSWAVMPLNETFVLADIPFGIIFLLAISSLGVYGIILAGWASNSNYAFLGALRSTAQMISYEITISFVILTVIFFAGSYNLSDIVYAQTSCWFVFPLLPITLIFFVCMLAETNRAPFDLPEAEAELVAGYNIDYSSITFALFFLGEYANMLLMSGLMVFLFFGGWLPFPFFSWVNASFIFALKLVFFAFSFIWVRATLPRYRYDQLMSLGWKIFLPFTFGFFLFIFGLFFICEAFTMIPHLYPKGSYTATYISENYNQWFFSGGWEHYQMPIKRGLEDNPFETSRGLRTSSEYKIGVKNKVDSALESINQTLKTSGASVNPCATGDCGTPAKPVDPCATGNCGN